MDMMLSCITTFSHAYQSSVYPILFNLHSTIFMTQEENDQAFSISL